MTMRDDAGRRAAIRELRAKIKALEKPDKLKAKKARQERQKALSRAPGQRQPRIKDPAYLSFVRRQPCISCGKPGPSQAAHVRSGYPEAGWRPTGMAEKPDDTRTLPLCRDCHLDGPKAQHKGNERRWWQDLGVYPPDACADLRRAFEAATDWNSTFRPPTERKEVL